MPVFIFILLLVSHEWNEHRIISAKWLSLVLKIFLEEFLPKSLIRLKVAVCGVFLHSVLIYVAWIKSTIVAVGDFINIHVLLLFVEFHRRFLGVCVHLDMQFIRCIQLRILQ